MKILWKFKEIIQENRWFSTGVQDNFRRKFSSKKKFVIQWTTRWMDTAHCIYMFWIFAKHSSKVVLTDKTLLIFKNELDATVL